ncbi:MAG TPA: TetR/AcrR family transcriptional regulator C-terminal domain-containing protein [Umezawaea sp.]|nr:TetR/AcrR family transcriptional regulator C-terminal domain-containing protein [Umezawaea sp.]
MTPPPNRRERPAKPALTRNGIVAAAVDLLRAGGLRQVTTRRLAEALDTAPASLYVYVRNTAELHAAVLDDLLGTVDVEPAGGPWRDRLVRVLTSYVRLLLAHPGLAASALVARPSGPRYVNLVEALLALLAEGGVPPGQAAWGVDVLLQLATATAVEHSNGESEEDWRALAAVVRDASPETHPHVAALGADLLSGPPEARLTWGLNLLINGIAHTARPS